jgi:hypothetical protein
MASVANNNTNVLLGRELKGLGNVLGGSDVDCVGNIIAQCAGLGDRVERITGAIGEEWSHDRRGRFIANF